MLPPAGSFLEVDTETYQLVEPTPPPPAEAITEPNDSTATE